eukprot:gene34783-39327_t
MHAAAAPAAEAGEAKWHGAQMDFSKSMSYGDYLGLAPYLRKFGQFTIPDFLGARYG